MTSTIHAAGMGGVVVDELRVSVDIEHTWDDDLTLSLRAPDGTKVVLVDRHGGRGDDFRNTLFTDDADTPINAGPAPFVGAFRPQQALSAFQDAIVRGDWTLEVQDNATQDGGTLHAWVLEITTKAAVPRRDTSCNIFVRFDGGLTPSQRSVFQLAASRWAEIVVGDLPDVQVLGEAVDDVLIVAKGERIDGPNGVLGQAGPTHMRARTLLPARGIMSFDTADLASMEQSGSLVDVIIHEMGHVLGIGTLWEDAQQTDHRCIGGHGLPG